MYDIAILSYAWMAIQTAALAGLYFVYRKKEHWEAGFGLKLLGYFLLGCFSFRINSLSIPLGFAAYMLLFRRPALNALPKRKAAIVGFMVFLCGFIYHLLPDQYVSTHQVTVPASERNIHAINWQQDWNEISRYTGSEAIVQDMRVNFEPDGTVEQMNMYLIRDMNTDHTVYYSVTLEPSKPAFRIQSSQTHQKDPKKPSATSNIGLQPTPVQHVRMATLVRMLTDHSIQELMQMPPGHADGYGISVDGQIMSGKALSPRDSAYVIEGAHIRKLQPEQPIPLPAYYQARLFRMVKNPPQYDANGSYTVSSHSDRTQHYYVAP